MQLTYGNVTMRLEDLRALSVDPIRDERGLVEAHLTVKAVGIVDANEFRSRAALEAALGRARLLLLLRCGQTIVFDVTGAFKPREVRVEPVPEVEEGRPPRWRVYFHAEARLGE